MELSASPGPTYLLDTNCLIYYFQAAPELDPIFRRIEKGEVRPAVSVITVVELLGFSRLTRQDEARLQAFLEGFVVVPVDVKVAHRAADLKRRYGIKTPDAIIAATALLENACLVTRDQALLDRIPGLESLNPFKSR